MRLKNPLIAALSALFLLSGLVFFSSPSLRAEDDDARSQYNSDKAYLRWLPGEIRKVDGLIQQLQSQNPPPPDLDNQLAFLRAAKKKFEDEQRVLKGLPPKFGNWSGQERDKIKSIHSAAVADFQKADAFLKNVPYRGGTAADAIVHSGGGKNRPGRPSDPNAVQYASSMIDSGQAALDGGNPQAAAENFTQALALDPTNPDALNGNAMANYDLGNYQAAYNNAHAALQVNPNDSSAFSVMQLSQSQGATASPGDAAQAAAALSQGASASNSAAPAVTLLPASGGGASASAPAPAPTLNNPAFDASNDSTRQAAASLNLGDLHSAIARATKAIELNSQNARAYNLRAAAHAGLGQNEEAVKDAAAGLAITPKSVPLWVTKSYAMNRVKDYKGAFEAANTALSLNPSDAAAHANRAFARAGMGDRQGMMQELRQAAALDPRFEASVQSAVQMPDNSDVFFLFPGEKDRRAAAATTAAAPASRDQRFWKLAISSVLGGVLLAAGLLPMLIKRGRAASPAAAAGPIKLRLPTDRHPRTLGGNLDILGQIGAGGMGVVFEGRDRVLDRRVAIKKMRSELAGNPRERERFIAEAKTVAALQHPNIVSIYSIVEDGPDVYLVFEHVSGATVFDILSQRGRLEPAQAAGVTRAMAEALDYAHGKGVIHRDLKTSNVMINADNRVKVMDFGIARIAKDAMTRYAMTNTVLGTPPYMAPEQEQGVVCRESDLYALAVCFYEMLTGRLPFSGTGSSMLVSKMNRVYPAASALVPGLGRGVDDFFERAFAPDPKERISSARSFIGRLEAAFAMAARTLG